MLAVQTPATTRTILRCRSSLTGRALGVAAGVAVLAVLVVTYVLALTAVPTSLATTPLRGGPSAHLTLQTADDFDPLPEYVRNTPVFYITDDRAASGGDTAPPAEPQQPRSRQPVGAITAGG